MIEEWRPIPGYETFYEASNYGRVRSLDRHVRHIWRGNPKTIFKAGRILSPETDDDGYLRVRLSDEAGKQKKFGIHQVVALAFIPNPENLPEVAHIDHRRQNNAPGNLKWASRAGNHSDSVIENRYAFSGPGIGKKRTFTADDIRSIRARYEAGERQVAIANSLGVRQEQIRKIVMRERWTHIE
jgi:hypothetical protein